MWANEKVLLTAMILTGFDGFNNLILDFSYYIDFYTIICWNFVFYHLNILIFEHIHILII